MLLTRLAEHAGRIEGLPPPFYRIRSVRWAIRLQADGTPAAFTLADVAGSDQPAGQPMAVPYIWRSGQRPPAVLLADDLRYVTAYPKDDSEQACADAGRRNQDYVALVARWRDGAPDDPVAQAVASLFETGLHTKLNVPDTAKATDVAAIMVDGQWAHLRESAVAFWGIVARERKASAGKGICLVCGQSGSCCLIHVDAAGARSMRCRWVVLVRSRGCPAYQASSRITLMAVAAARCSRRVLARPR